MSSYTHLEGNLVSTTTSRHALLWNSVHQRSNPRPQPLSGPGQSSTKDTAAKPVTAEPGTKACARYNHGKCRTQADHPSDHHICAYCLNVAKRLCIHQERFFHHKIDEEGLNN